MLALTTPDETDHRFLDSMSMRGSWLGDTWTGERDGQQVVVGSDPRARRLN
jgi:hypothetical protein